MDKSTVEILVIALFGILAYLIGSLPTSVWWGKAYFGIDVRDYGSGNAGATNTFRVLGKRAGIIVMLVDFQRLDGHFDGQSAVLCRCGVF
jgi:acyl phosphate:glycerol-3-phosphate acyltransferase